MNKHKEGNTSEQKMQWLMYVKELTTLVVWGRSSSTSFEFVILFGATARFIPRERRFNFKGVIGQSLICSVSNSVLPVYYVSNIIS